MLYLNIIKYCAEECDRQKSGELSVYDMVNAWEYANGIYENCLACRRNAETLHDIERPKLTLEFIEEIGKLVEPADNKNGFRKVPIYVGNGWEYVEKAPWDRVPEMLELLLQGFYGERDFAEDEYPRWQSVEGRSANAEEQFYYEFENIHPFVDGNGRAGKILYNYLCGTLDNPIMPPNFWGISNP